MLQAKMATREAKPNGLYWLIPENVNGFFKDKKVGDLHGLYTCPISCLESAKSRKSADIVDRTVLWCIQFSATL